MVDCSRKVSGCAVFAELFHRGRRESFHSIETSVNKCWERASYLKATSSSDRRARRMRRKGSMGPNEKEMRGNVVPTSLPDDSMGTASSTWH